MDGNPTDPRDNPTAGGHLPGAGEVGGPSSYHDPLTQDTTDQDLPITPDDQPLPETHRTDAAASIGEADVQPEADPTSTGNTMPPAGTTS